MQYESAQSFENLTAVGPYNILSSSLRALLCAAFGVLVGLSGAAQNKSAGGTLKFKPLSFEQGASSNWVFDIAEDSDGFVWFAGFSGLTRYDGRTLKNFMYDPDKETGISDNNISGVLPLKEGKIICSTLREGFSIYDSRTQTFRNLKKQNTPQLPTRYISKGLRIGENDFLYAAGQARSLLRCSLLGDSVWFQKIPLEWETKNLHFRENKSRDLLRDPRNPHLVWVVGNFRLFTFDLRDNTLQMKREFEFLLDDNYRFELITAVDWLDDDRLVFNLAKHGFYTYHVRNDSLSFLADDPVKHPERTVCIFKSPKGYYRTGTTEGRLFNFFPERAAFAEVQIAGTDHKKAHIHCIYESENGTVYLGTKGAGVLKHDPSEQRFRTVLPDSTLDLNAGIPHGRLPYYYANSLKYPGKIYRIEPESGSVTPVKGPVSEAFAHAVFTRTEEGIPVIHNGESLFRISDDGSTLIPFGHEKEIRPPGGWPGTITRIACSSNGRWAVCGRDFIVCTAPGKQPVVRSVDMLRFSSARWEDIAFERDRLILLQHEGFAVYDLISDSVFYPQFANPERRDDVRSMRSLVPFEEGYLVASAVRGLYKLRIDRDSVHIGAQYTAPRHLLSNNNYAATSDIDGKVWLSCDRGYSRFDPETERSLHFGFRQNLPVLYRDNPFVINSDGTFASHGYNDLVWGHLTALLHTEKDTKLIIHSPDKNGTIHPLSNHPDSTTVSLRYDENIFDISWSHLNASSTDFYTAEYMLEGLDANWNAAGDEYTARYTGLQPGKYSFRVRITSAGERGIIREASLPIEIKAHFSATWWFRAILAALIGLTVYAGLKYRLGTVRREQALITEYNRQLADMEMQFLRSQMNPHFMFNSLNSLKHFILLNEREKAVDYLARFSGLIRAILRFSGVNYITLQEELVTLRTYVELEQSRFSEKFEYAVHLAPKSMQSKCSCSPSYSSRTLKTPSGTGSCTRKERASSVCTFPEKETFWNVRSSTTESGEKPQSLCGQDHEHASPWA